MKLKILVFTAVAILFLKCEKEPSAPGATKVAEKEFLKPITNQKYFIISKNGANLRLQPRRDAQIAKVLSYAAEVSFIDTGSTIEIDNIDDAWYEVDHLGSRGWVFGGYLSSIPPKYDFTKFKGGCLRQACDYCDAIRFAPNGEVFIAIGCHDGNGKGKWHITENKLVADIDFFPGCYDSCLTSRETNYDRDAYAKASTKYTEEHKFSARLTFFQTEIGAVDYTLEHSTGNHKKNEEILPKPVGRMRHYSRSK